MRNKRLFAMSMALLLALQSPLTSMSVNATEVGGKTTDTTEYVVQVDNDKEFQDVIEDNEDAVVEDESVTELEEENIVVLELSEKEAKALEKDKNIVVEENVLFCANTMDSSEAQQEDTATATLTEEVVNEEPLTTESVMEEAEETTEKVIREKAITKESTTQITEQAVK